MTCDSCGSDDEATLPVRRTYVTPAVGGDEPTRRTLDEIEQWCFACRTHYPHDAV